MTYEEDGASFPADAYEVRGWSGIAWHALGWETQADEDTEWDGICKKTGKVVCCMVGDDRHFVFDEKDLKSLDREEYCGSCGQIGCGHG